MQSIPELFAMEEVYAQRFLPEYRSVIPRLKAISADEFAALIEKARSLTPQASRTKAIAKIPITGPLECRATVFGEMVGMSSYERIGAMFDHFVRDDAVSAIILDVASPGGEVYGAQELADKIFQARTVKPIVAVVNPLMASGAFWVAAAAHQIVVTPSGDVGSVGVIAMHEDNSAALEKEGRRITIIKSAGAPYKGELSDVAALSKEAVQYLQSRADAIEKKFMSDLAKFRGVSVSHVAEHFGEGRVVNASGTVAAGMADRIGTMEEYKGKMESGRWRFSPERAELVLDCPTRKEILLEKAKGIMAVAEGSVTEQS